MNIWTKSFFFLVCFLGVERLTHQITDGFSLQRIQSKHFMMHSPQKPPQEIEKLNGQSFRYVGSGSQSFAFVSDDDQYVLKFFKFKGSFFNLHRLPLRKHSFRRALESCLLYQETLKDESGIVYCHLSPSSLNLPTIRLIDPSSCGHAIDLSKFSFVIQRRVETTRDRLIRLKKEGRQEEAKLCFDRLFDLLIKRYHLGFSDKDPNLIDNFGFLGDAPICLDIGGLIHDRPDFETYFWEIEIEKARSKSVRWLKTYDPDLIPYVEKKVEETKSKRR